MVLIAPEVRIAIGSLIALALGAYYIHRKEMEKIDRL